MRGVGYKSVNRLLESLECFQSAHVQLQFPCKYQSCLTIKAPCYITDCTICLALSMVFFLRHFESQRCISTHLHATSRLPPPLTWRALLSQTLPGQPSTTDILFSAAVLNRKLYMGASDNPVQHQGRVDSVQVRSSSAPVAYPSQTAQHSSYVPAHPNIQATQTFFDSAPAASPPAPVAQGYSVGAINTTQPLYCPLQQVIYVFCSTSQLASLLLNLD